MRTISFNVKLLSDVIVSLDSGTTGGHSCLDYIPGQVFLGVCAMAYKEFENDGLAFDVFHSGKVRFSNAYPLSRGAATYPLPFAWHYEKGKTATGKTSVEKNSIIIADGNSKDDQQLVQMRKDYKGYITPGGGYVDPEKNYRMKTAIERDKGYRAKDEHLFGYESIRSGSSWRFSIDIDDELDTSRVDQKLKTILTAGKLRIGRSRNAEYGQVEISENSVFGGLPTPEVNKDTTIIYCLSDLALVDENTGYPCLLPDGSYFGLSEAQLLPERSFIRTTSHSPFNSKRRRHDLVQNCIEKGSVLVFNKTCENPKELQSSLARGVGLFREFGLGRVLVNPKFMTPDESGHPVFETVPTPDESDTNTNKSLVPAVSEVDSNLKKWITARYEKNNLEDSVASDVEKWCNLIITAIRKNPADSPGRSQWSQLRDEKLLARNINEIHTKLFGEKGLFVDGVEAKKWTSEKIMLSWGDKNLTYADFLKEVLEWTDTKKLNRVYLSLRMLGKRIPRMMNQEGL